MNFLDEYMDVLLNSGLKVREKDSLIIIIPKFYEGVVDIIKKKTETKELKELFVLYEDVDSEVQHYLSGCKEKYMWISEAEFQYIDEMIKNKAKLLILRSTKFDVFKDLTEEQMVLRNNNYDQDFMRLYYYVQANIVTYCLGALPNIMWAQKMYPQLDGQEAFDMLWDKMSKAIYLDTENPTKYWEERANELVRRKDILNTFVFDSIVVKGEDTELELELDKKHIWNGGFLQGPDNEVYIPNIPTEEVFTTPVKTGVNGKININHKFYFGTEMVEQYSLSFKEGECIKVECDNTTFEEKFFNYLKSNVNGTFLGEIALVSNDAGVKQQNTFFYDMVYDENASCHFAFGNSYKTSIQHGEEMSDQEFVECGGNISTMHMDFMYDSENMCIYGKKDEEMVLILEHGIWRL